MVSSQDHGVPLTRPARRRTPLHHRTLHNLLRHPCRTRLFLSRFSATRLSGASYRRYTAAYYSLNTTVLRNEPIDARLHRDSTVG